MEQFHKHCFDKWLHITTDDYNKARKYYAAYLKLLKEIIDSDQKGLDSFKKKIFNNNPWKTCVESEREPEKYRSIADSDYAIIMK